MLELSGDHIQKLGDEDLHAFQIVGGHDLGDAMTQLSLSRGERLVVVDVAHASDGLSDQ